MPVVQGPYRRPGGFLYNYFVAAVFGFFGENAANVYLVQAGLLGLAIVGMAATFGGFLSRRARLGYLVALTGFMAVDVFRYYTVRLLSENLVLVLLPPFFLTTLQIVSEGRMRDAVVGGVWLGLAVLTRPNLILMGAGTAFLVLAYARPGRRALAAAATFLMAFSLALAPMAFRNYVVTGVPSLDVITTTHDWLGPRVDLAPPLDVAKVAHAAATTVDFYGKRVLFCVGFASLADPGYRIRPHWVLAWLGAALFVLGAIRRRRCELWEALALTFIVLYLAPLVAVAHLANYGFRMVVPVIPVVLLLAVRGLDRGAGWSEPRLPR
jgi:hypothetical protein